MKAEIIIEIINALLQYGPTAIIKIAESMKEKELTVDDIKTLFINKDPEEYFDAQED